MPFITQGKTNFKYLLIVIILAAILGGGYWFYWNWWIEKQTEKLTQFSEVKKPAKVEDETAELVPSDVEGWKTYRNEEYGFEVKYPSQLNPEEESADIVADLFLLHRVNFLEPGNRDSIFHIAVSDISLAAEVERTKRAVIGHAADELKSETEIRKNGYSGVRLEFVLYYPEQPHEGTTVVIISKGKYSYSIFSDVEFADQILSTFRFLE